MKGPKNLVRIDQTKCGQCGIEQSNENTYKNSLNKQTGLQTYCKTCFLARSRTRKLANPSYEKNRSLKKTFGITLEDYNKLFIEQKGCCALCNKHQSEFKIALAIDHDHDTDKIRGLLCFPCNALLGHYEKLTRTNLIKVFDVYINRSKMRLVCAD